MGGGAWRRCTRGSRAGSPGPSHGGGRWPYLRGLLGRRRKNGWQLAEQAGERHPRRDPAAAGHRRLGRRRGPRRPARLRGRAPGRPGARCWSSTRPASSRRARTRSGCSASTRAPPAGSRTARSASSSPTPAPRGGRSSTGSCTCPRLDRRPARCRAARVPEEVAFPTKPQLARAMLERALDAGVPAGWVTADEVYGGDRPLRRWLEDRGLSLRAGRQVHRAAAASPRGRRGPRADAAGRRRAGRAVGGLSAGDGAKGRRLYDWARVALAAPAAAGMARWLLVRRSRADGELAYYACFGPAGTPLAGWSGWPGPAGRSRSASRAPRARSGWTTTRCAAGPAGTGTSPWRCWPTPSWPSPAPRPPPPSAKGDRWPDRRAGLLPLTVPEVRRLLVALVWPTPAEPGFVLAWSRWRRRHQARARRAHYQRRERQVRLEY